MKFGAKDPKRYKSYRDTKKSKAATHYGVAVEEITEVRVLIPAKYKQKLIKQALTIHKRGK